ncbi:hypothetical protein BDW74DRAFT_86022 [Aspergillus multicolor]|uniref:uncharacterized protein n=1 Tax=Aspergillus multicolor TaxID=41759 RepID=UPI003CCCACBD
MSSVRFTSALARRSLNSPLPCAAPPTSSALRSFSSASYSAFSSSSPSSSSSSSTARALASARVSRPAATRSLYRIQSRNMATEIQKIKVKNPVVELDGDEVGSFRAFDRKAKWEIKFPSAHCTPDCVALRCATALLYSGRLDPREAHFRPSPPHLRGKTARAALLPA